MSVPGPFDFVDVNFDRSTELALNLEEVAGFVTIQYGPNASLSGGAATGLANDATVYTATIRVNDATNKAISITGSAAQTFTTLLSELNSDLAVGPNDAEATLDGNNIVITSFAVGPTSRVEVTNPGTLFSAIKKGGSGGFGLEAIRSVKGHTRYLRWDKLDAVTQQNIASVMALFLAAAPANTNVLWTQGFDTIILNYPFGPALENTTPTGLNTSATYDLGLEVDSTGSVQFSFLGKATFIELIDDAISPALQAAGINATATFVPGNPARIRFTSNSFGSSSAVIIDPGTFNDLVTALAGFSPITTSTAGLQNAFVSPATLGTDLAGLPADTYDFDVTIDGGVTQALSIVVAGGEDYDDIAALMSAAIAGGTTLFNTPASAFVVTSSSIGDGSSVLLAAGTAGSPGGDLFAALIAAGATSGFQELFVLPPTLGTFVTALAASTYSFDVLVDGGPPLFLTITTIGGEDYDAIAALMSAASPPGPGGFTVVYDTPGSKFVFTSNTTGPTSVVIVPGSGTAPAAGGPLFATFPGVDAKVIIPGAPTAGLPSPITITPDTPLDGITAELLGVDGSSNLTFPKTFQGVVYSDWKTVLENVRGPNGFGPLFSGSSGASFEKEIKPKAKGDAIQTAVYWDGSVWKYFDSGATLGSTVNPPEL